MKQTSHLIRRRVACAALLACLAGCGGGDQHETVQSSSPKSFALYGDSYGYGGYFDPPGVLARYSPDPAEMIAAHGLTVYQRSHNGMTLKELVSGGRLEHGLAEVTGADGVYVTALADQLKSEPATHVVVGVGMADALFSDMGPDAFRALLRSAVKVIRDAGKTPIFRGFELFAQNELMTPARMARRDLFDAIVREEALSLGVFYIDVASLNEREMAADGLHKTRAANQRIAAFIGAQLSEGFR